jgi:hypothetical protein
VVHTLGTLLEDTKYKAKIKEGDLLGLVGSFVGGALGSGENPLESSEDRMGSYEVMNRDAGNCFLFYFILSTSIYTECLEC